MNLPTRTPNTPAPDWADANCHGSNLDFIDPQNTRERNHALNTCRGCTLQIACLTWALDNNETGIWGGTTGYQRNKLRRGAAA